MVRPKVTNERIVVEVMGRRLDCPDAGIAALRMPFSCPKLNNLADVQTYANGHLEAAHENAQTRSLRYM
jgi:hypothetical protein